MSGFAVGDLVRLNPLVAGNEEESTLAIITAIELGSIDVKHGGYYWVLDHKGFNRPVHRSWIRQLERR